MVMAIDREVRNLAKARKTPLPFSARVKPMNGAVSRISHEGTPASIEGNRKWLPRVSQACCRGRQPVRPQHKTSQSKHTQSMIASIANKKIAAAYRNAPGVIELPGAAACASQAGHHFKLALTRIETFQKRVLTIKQVDTAVRSQRHIGGEL